MKISETFEDKAGIYIFTNKINGKQYVGESINIQQRMYPYHNSLNSDRVIDRAINKYGIENFQLVVEYLPDFKKADLLELEESLIKLFNCRVPLGYNVSLAGMDNTGRILTPEHKAKIKMANTGKVRSDEQRKNLSNGQRGNTKTKGITQSVEWIDKRRMKQIGQKRTPEQIKRISDSRKGSIPWNKGLKKAKT